MMGRTQAGQVARMLADPVKYNIGGEERTLREWCRKLYGEDYERDLASFAGGPDYPVYCVSWNEAVDFCEKLTARERAAGRLGSGWSFRLPAEAEWEYACRAGSAAATYGGDLTIKGENNAPELDAIGWYAGNSSVGYPAGKGIGAGWPEKQYPGGRAGPREVGGKRPNAWGLHDMIGNVWEWCEDWYGSYPGGGVTDPRGPGGGRIRVARGGSWDALARRCRAAVRGRGTPSFRGDRLGFRVCLAGPPE